MIAQKNDLNAVVRLATAQLHQQREHVSVRQRTEISDLVGVTRTMGTQIGNRGLALSTKGCESHVCILPDIRTTDI